MAAGLYRGRKTIKRAARNITRMQECGGAATAAGGLSFSDNDDILPSFLSLFSLSLSSVGGGKFLQRRLLGIRRINSL